MFSFTSMGGKIDKSINKGRGPNIFRISGQNCHLMGSLLPQDGSKPKFSQLYIYDTDNEISNRQNVFGVTSNKSQVDEAIDVELIQQIKDMLDLENPFVKIYRMAKNCFQEDPHVNLKLQLIGKRDKDGRTYNIPSCSEVAALIVGDITDCVDRRDIIVHTQTGNLIRISELHPSYLPLQYPLLFPFGDDGYRVDIPHRELPPDKKKPKKRNLCTMREFFFHTEFKTGKDVFHLFIIQEGYSNSS
ncbi:uncharacterized protein LOC110888420 [Helianthus annuus]|nr:uncharacterized protein LOC110888420 [Helianthus annuus]